MLNERYENNKKSSFPSSYELDLYVTQLKREYPFLSISDSKAKAQHLNCKNANK